MKEFEKYTILILCFSLIFNVFSTTSMIILGMVLSLFFFVKKQYLYIGFILTIIIVGTYRSFNGEIKEGVNYKTLY